MKREWVPGDVAMASGGFTGIVFRCDAPPSEDDSPWMTAREGRFYGGDSRVRPLVVIDPGPTEGSADELVRRLRAAANEADSDDATAVRWVADQIEQQAGPPKPEEPDTWGVVEASCVHSNERREWMRHKDGNWYVVGTDTKNNPDDWDSLIGPVVIREGIQ